MEYNSIVTARLYDEARHIASRYFFFVTMNASEITANNAMRTIVRIHPALRPSLKVLTCWVHRLEFHTQDKLTDTNDDAIAIYAMPKAVVIIHRAAPVIVLYTAIFNSF